MLGEVSYPISGCEPPRPTAGLGVERVQAAVLRGDVDQPVRADRWSGGHEVDSFACVAGDSSQDREVASASPPLLLARAVIERVEVTVVRPDVDLTVAADDRRALDGLTCLERPQALSGRSASDAEAGVPGVPAEFRATPTRSGRVWRSCGRGRSSQPAALQRGAHSQCP